MKFLLSTLEDLPLIFDFYDDAIAYQKKISNLHWEGFGEDMIKAAINENRQWKILNDAQEVVCIFTLTFEDEIIWKEKENYDSIYIHRIVTSSIHRGPNYVLAIVEWAKEYVKTINRKYIRMDTWGNNPKLIEYYQKCGFNYLGNITMDNIEGLPDHYNIGTVLALFELRD